ncbi:hypothetical protein [Massilia niastensis]|uniref:hypothetical protein n=1 Tax=Massilia niastensis TaxID=544911 RepID=UPI00036C0FB4
MFAPFAGMPWFGRPAELRIEVSQRPDELQRELDELCARMHRRGDALHGLAVIGIDFPGLVFRYREADGEHYVYAVDAARRCLAGYTVLNRLVEVSRRADRHLRAPHSKYAVPYQGRGIATAVYRWWLDTGACLISGARQSRGAHALWHSLARRYQLLYVELRDKSLRCLGSEIDARIRDDLHTRMILLGRERDLDWLATHAGMLLQDAGSARTP